MEAKWTTTISCEDLEEWGIRKCGSWELFKEEYCREAKTKIEEAKSQNTMDSQVILDDATMLLFKEYICDEIDDSITKVESFSYDIRYNTYLVTYSKEVK